MTNVTFEKMEEMVKEYFAKEFDPTLTYAIRYDNKNYEVGDFVANSKSNTNRDDERDFPRYGTEEYNNCEELNGTSCYELNRKNNMWYVDTCEEAVEWMDEYGFCDNMSGQGSCNFKHCSLVCGDKNNNEFCEDAGEIVLNNCKVLVRLF